ncbi:MAG: phosphonate ABC transporter, permease protein PhnE [Candidatus Aquicultor sp.]|nr:phosphonate ABC transporter, permease protein PhnE [Candidatus Aquicultor sp.]
MPDTSVRALEGADRPGWKLSALLKKGMLGALVIFIYIWSAYGTNLSVSELVRGYPFMADFLNRMMPPSTANLSGLVAPTIETIQIAIWGTTLAVVLSLPLGLLAAQNITPHPAVYYVTRWVLNALRAVNDLIFALIFVAAVGLGPFPGVLALGVHSAGMLGKFYAEAIENVDKGTIEALEATGAHKLQIIRYAIIPQIVPEFVTYNVYRFEHNLRQATVLGMVGAGGLGFELITSMRLFKYQDAATILLVILLVVTGIDHISNKIRARLI